MTGRSPAATARHLAADPRHYQIAVLAALLAWGMAALELQVRTGHIVFGAAVAALSAFTEIELYEPNGAIWALAPCAILVPLLDRWRPSANARGARNGTESRRSPAPVTGVSRF